jgi:hypothetical protein
MQKALLRKTIPYIGIVGLLLAAGCTGPHYTDKELIIDGKPPPKIHGPNDPLIAVDLSKKLWPKSPLIDRSGEIGVTPFKSIGVQGWEDYHMHAIAHGRVIQHEFSSNGFLTTDIRLESLTLDDVPVPLNGPRYIRLEIFLGKVSVDKAVYQVTNVQLVAQGRFVWDSDGWFEIHPQKTGDVVLATTNSPSQGKTL